MSTLTKKDFQDICKLNKAVAIATSSASFEKYSADRLATTKQFWAITVHFSKIVQHGMGIDKRFFFKLRKQIESVVARNHPKGMTHGEVQAFRGSNELPKYLIGNLKLDFLVGKKAKTAPKKPTVSVKPVKKASPKPTVSKKVVVKPTVSTQESKDMDTRLTFLEGEFSVMSDDIQTIKSGMEMIIQTLKG